MNVKRSLIYLLFRFIRESFHKKQSNNELLFSIKYLLQYIALNGKHGSNTLSLEKPLITFKSYEFLEEILNSDMVVFEFGSGGSTLYFSTKVKKVISVEHDEIWFNKLNSKIDNKHINNIDLTFAPPQKNDIPKVISNSDDRYLGYDYFNYVNSINTYPDSYFDFIVVDGRARVECLNASIKKLKAGGYLLFDNSNRERYKSILHTIEHYCICKGIGPVISSMMFSETKIYKFDSI